MAEVPALLGGDQIIVVAPAVVAGAAIPVGVPGVPAFGMVTVTDVAGPVPWALIADTDNV